MQNIDDIKARVRKVQLAATLDTMLTIRQKREYLARVVRARVSELAEDSDLWQVTITEDGVTRKLPDKLLAIALHNELSGEAASNGEDVTVVVRIGGPDDDEAPFISDRSLARAARWGKRRAFRRPIDHV
jgi:3-dehydroquinate synthase class II